MNSRLIFFLSILCSQCLPAFSEMQISEKSQWQGERKITETITVNASASLTVSPGSRIFFGGEGKIICYGDFKAEKVIFEADSVLEGQSRIHIENPNRTVEFRNCTFNNMVTMKRRYQNEFLHVYGGRFTMTGCEFNNCSALDVVRCPDALLENNIFNSPKDKAAVFSYCDRGNILNNVFHGGDGTQTFLTFYYSSNCSAISNRFYGKGYGIYFYGSTNNCRALSNFMFDTTVGFALWGEKVADNLILKNLVFKPGSMGFRIINCGIGNRIMNCVVWKAAYSGVDFTEGKELYISDSVLTGGKFGVTLSPKAGNLILENDLFWENKKDFRDESEKTVKKNLHFEDPLFVAPEEGNFRPQIKSFGYKQASPLINSGTIEGYSIGLYPVIKK